MKNILNIIRYDLSKCTSSVVAIITIMGLCIIPCLYAWFNIFSNWAPYDAGATGRISVAVASEDKGADAMGIKVNVGDKIISALEANDAIGWVFVDTQQEAIDGVYAGDYYAALIIPEDFSADVLSFISGDLDNPRLKYYENEKKNAIAPKITGKARTAVQEEVNATFIKTLAGYVSDAASMADAAGFDPQQLAGDLSGKLELLGERLDDCLVMVNAAISLSESAESLLRVSGALTSGTSGAASSGKDVLDSAADIPPEDDGSFGKVTKSIEKISRQNKEDLTTVENRLLNAVDDRDAYNWFVEHELDNSVKLVSAMISTNDKAAKALKDLGLNALAEDFADFNKDLTVISDKLGLLKTANDENWEDMRKIVQDILEVIVGGSPDDAGAMGIADLIISSLDDGSLADMEKKLHNALADTRTAIQGMKDSLSGIEGMMGDLGDIFDRYSRSIGKLDRGLGSTRADLLSMHRGIDVLSELLDRVASNEDLNAAGGILTDDADKLSSYLASPVRMNTTVLYPIDNYGSAMAPFYTVLAQWVGALLTAVLIKVDVRRRKGLENLRTHQRFFGRYGLYLLVGLSQALIVSLGDLLYVGIQCHHPVLFVLAACVNGIVFTMINYALVFSLDNIGLGAGVIILVMQVAGSGGTYPVEVLPGIFRTLYPLMPFRYAMDAMRECIGGMYGHTYAGCVGILWLFFLGAALLGLLLYRPALGLNRIIAEGKRKSEIML